LLLLAAALSPPTAAAQRTPQPVFTELFTYDPATPSQLLGKWRISSQLDSKLQPLRVGVVEDRIGKTVGRITVQEGDGLAGANEAMLQARDYICNSEGSRAGATCRGRPMSCASRTWPRRCGIDRRVVSEFLPHLARPPDGVAPDAGLGNRSAAIALKAPHAYSGAKSAQCRRLE
jgi:hypothetical protein